MKRTAIVVAVLLVVAAASYWVAQRTQWESVTIPIGATGEARRNPFYAALKFAQALGLPAAWQETFASPTHDTVLITGELHWTLNGPRRAAIEAWVAGGGDLVMAGPVASGGTDFERWTGIGRKSLEAKALPTQLEHSPKCVPLAQFREVTSSEPTDVFAACDVDFLQPLTSRTTTSWRIGFGDLVYGVRVPVGQGTVTVVNSPLFSGTRVLEGDHAQLLVRAAGLAPGRKVLFLSESDSPSILALSWRHGAGAIALGLGCLGLAMWRQGTRLGPFQLAPAPARRSLAEQIRYSGRFLLRHGGAEALHAASVRALDDTASRRIHGYGHLPAQARTAALALATGYPRETLASALHHPGARQPAEVLETIAVIEEARRRLDIRPHPTTSLPAEQTDR